MRPRDCLPGELEAVTFWEDVVAVILAILIADSIQAVAPKVWAYFRDLPYHQ